MTIWFGMPDLDSLCKMNADTAASHLGIEFTGIGDDWLEARMPVDQRTKQPMGLLHGGASVLLAETVGSAASMLCIDPQKSRCVGLEISANHVRAVRSGYVIARARALHTGAATHVWDIRIVDEAQRLVCASRLTVVVLQQ